MTERYVIYGKNDCKFCDKAKALLDSAGLDYDYFTLGVDYDREELQELAPGATTVPQIWYTDNIENENVTAAVTGSWLYIGGFNELEKFVKKETLMDEVEIALNEGATVTVVFTKADGTERTMVCTKNPELIARTYTAPEKKTERVRGPSEALAVFDLEKNDWRSFRLDSVKSYMVFEEVE